MAEAGGWERIGVDRGRRRARGRSPGCGSGSRPLAPSARAAACRWPRSARWPRSPVGIAERAPGRPRLAAIDARREQAFAALYDASGELSGGRWRSPPEELAGRLAELSGGSPVAAGDGSLRFRQRLESAGVEVLPAASEAHRIAARHVCALAAGVEPGPPEDVRPVYLRRPDAEVWREQRDRDSRTRLIGPSGLRVRRLVYGDLPSVLAIERRSFQTPWSLAMFVLELSKPSGICLGIAERARPRRLPGLLPLRRRLAPDEHRGRARAPA